MKEIVKMNQDEFFAFLRKHLGDVAIQIEFSLEDGKAGMLLGDLTKPPFKYEEHGRYEH